MIFIFYFSVVRHRYFALFSSSRNKYPSLPLGKDFTHSMFCGSIVFLDEIRTAVVIAENILIFILNINK
jgi:hypothetical protein